MAMPHIILIVDDDPNVCSALARLVESWGYQAVAETDSFKALAGKKPFSLVLLDIIMPQMFGLDFLAAAKDLKPELAFIMVTGVQDETIAQKAMDLGALAYVHKPFDIKNLENRIKSALDGVPAPKQS